MTQQTQPPQIDVFQPYRPPLERERSSGSIWASLALLMILGVGGAYAGWHYAGPVSPPEWLAWLPENVAIREKREADLAEAKRIAKEAVASIKTAELNAKREDIQDDIDSLKKKIKRLLKDSHKYADKAEAETLRMNGMRARAKEMSRELTKLQRGTYHNRRREAWLHREIRECETIIARADREHKSLIAKASDKAAEAKSLGRELCSLKKQLRRVR